MSMCGSTEGNSTKEAISPWRHSLETSDDDRRKDMMPERIDGMEKKIGVVVEEPQWRMEASGLYTAVAGECLYTAVAGECRDELISLHAYTPQWRVSAMMN